MRVGLPAGEIPAGPGQQLPLESRRRGETLQRDGYPVRVERRDDHKPVVIQRFFHLNIRKRAVLCYTGHKVVQKSE